MAEQTIEQWEGEKARIDEMRASVVKAALHHTGLLDATAMKIAATAFPYPPKPEKTVTLKGSGYEYALAGGMLRYRCAPDCSWITLYSESDLRLLASLLPENQEKDG